MPHTYRNAWAALILITTLLLLTTGRPAHAASELAIGDYQLVSSKRISRTEYEYTYSASITNTGRDAQDVIAYLKLDVGGVIILDDKLEFGDVPGGSSVESLDTFTIRQNRLHAFTSSDIDWKIHTTNLSYSTLPDPDKIIIDPEGAVYPVNQLLILLEDGYASDDAENIASSVNARVIGAMPLGNIYQLEVPASTSEELSVFIQTLRSDQRVQAVVRNNALQLQYATDLAHLRENDPTQTKTLAYDNVKLEEAWRKINSINSSLNPLSSVTIGIYDSGIAKGHPEFKFDVDVIEGPDKDYGGEVCGGSVSSHGTEVAGIIGANNLSSTVELPSDSDEMNGILSGVSGLNYKLLINPIRLDSDRLLRLVGWFSDKLDAISDLVMRDAKIINMSIAGVRCDKLNDDAKRKGCVCITQDEFDEKKNFYISIFSGIGFNSAGIKARSVLFVASAGNDGVDVNFNLPGGIALPNLITVGGTTLENKRALYTLSRGSNFGFGVDIAAPGEKVHAPAYEKTLFLDDYYYRFFSGTSASAPLVTGVAGLIKAIKPDLTPNQIKNILIDTGTPLPDQQIGPLVNAYAAVCHKDVLNCSSSPPATGDILLIDDFNDGNLTPNWTFTGDTAKEEEGVLKILTNQTDNGGRVSSRHFKLPENGLVISRKAKLHYANSFAIPWFRVRYLNELNETKSLFSIFYGNMSYNTFPYYSVYGTFYARGDSSPHSRESRNMTVEGPPVIWDKWFEEHITYERSTGKIQYLRNGTPEIIDIAPVLPAGASIWIEITAWGWWTGHSHFVDDLVIKSQ